MSHDLATTGKKKRVAMAYAKDKSLPNEGTPWHRLGTAVEEAFTAEEAFTLGGFAYQVASCPLYYADPRTGDHKLLESHVLNVRKDADPNDLSVHDGERFGIVSKNYQVVQNTEAFSFLDALVAEGEVKYHTVGALDSGKRIWLLCKLPGHIQVGSAKDPVDQYLLLFNSHDATTALRLFFTPVRVVCANTVAAAMAGGGGFEGGRGFSFRHMGDMRGKIDEARKALTLSSGYFKAFGEGAALLGKIQPTQQQVLRYFEALSPDPEKGDPANAKRTRTSLFGLYQGAGKGLDVEGVRGTAWAAYNAVTEYIDWHVPGRGAESRLKNAWFGDGAKLKERAWELALRIDSVDVSPGANGLSAANLG